VDIQLRHNMTATSVLTDECRIGGGGEAWIVNIVKTLMVTDNSQHLKYFVGFPFNVTNALGGRKERVIFLPSI
jgi:hypothetical protein